MSKIAVLKGTQGVIGFASLMPMYDNGERISVDLMRYRPGAPSGTMDFLFLSLFEWAKQEGYRVFNLGMSPLSNVGQSRYSFLSEKNCCTNIFTWSALLSFQRFKKTSN